MTYLLIGLVVLIFCMVVFFGAPYLPTFKRQSEVALDLLELKPGQTLLELGSGDGRVLRVAARRGLNAIGYEINPLLVLVSVVVTWKYRKQVRIIWGNYWSKQWPNADGIFVFLITRYMKKLDKKVSQYPHRPVKLVSFAFKIPGRAAAREKDGSYLYKF